MIGKYLEARQATSHRCELEYRGYTQPAGKATDVRTGSAGEVVGVLGW